MKHRFCHISGLLGFVFLLMTVQSSGQALDPPTPTCIETMANGDVLINWDIPADPGGEFTGYEIHHSPDGFVGVDNIEFTDPIYGNTSFLHVGALGGDVPNYYNLYTLSNDGSPQVSVASETYVSIWLTAGAGLNSTVSLAWTSPYLDFASVTGDYEIWMEYPAGTWQALGTIAHDPDFLFQSYVYTVEECQADLNFQIFYNAPSGCQFISNIDGGTFEDQEPPETPVIDVASIDLTTQEPVVSWSQVSDPDTYGYIIYQCVAGFPVPIDTVYAQDITSYEHTAIDIPPDLPESYTVAAFDSCNFANVSTTEGFCHRPVYLLPPNWGSCDLDLDLTWEPYEGRDVITYRIYVSENAGPFTQLDEVTGDILTYNHANLNANSNYEYYIEATFLGTSSFSHSNKRLINIQIDQAPSFTYLASVSVVGKGEVDIRVHTDETAVLDHLYILERRRKDGLLYTDVDYATAGAVEFIEFSDSGLNTDELQYEYRVHLVNDCGDTIRTTNTATTILLKGLANNERLANTLQWQPYQFWDGAIEGYTLYRSEEEGVLGNIINDLPGAAVVAEDDVQDELVSPGYFCYTLEAREEINSYGLSEISRSNQVCLQMDPKIWVPNAMMAFGVNNTFKPVIGFADFTTYRMRIYSRWGDRLFETTDIDEGWDGTWRGELVPEGRYVYYIEVKDGRGQLHERTGAVYMLVSGLE